MKSLPQQSANTPEWDNNLLRDLAYIKKNLRYPISKKVLVPGILFVLSFSSASFLIVNIISRHRNGDQHAVLPFIILAFMLLITFIATSRAIGTLRFVALAAPYDTNGNIALLNRFIESQRLVVFRHPDAPEVFQIISRNIDLFKDAREILVFIADDHRILINSHFTESNQTMQRHHKQMAQMLQEYMDKL